MGTLWQDLHYAVRMLAKHPGFTAAAVLTLALGIGANTAIFSVVNAVLLRPLPYAEPGRLVTMRSNQSLPDLEDIKAQSQSFAALGGAVKQALDYTGEGEPLQVQAQLVNADLFDALGVPARLGRTITPDEDKVGGARVVVLSHGFWQRRFGGDPGVLGRQMPLSGNSYTVVGVMPPEFNALGADVDLWGAVRVVNPVAAQFRGVHFLRTFLRLKPGVTIEEAQAEMAAIDQRLEQQYPDENKGRRRRLVGLQEYVVGDTKPALLVLFGAVGLVLLVAAANFSNLLLARAATRRSELAIRAALGAGRGRIARQLVTESVLLALCGGVAGLVLAMWGIDLLVALKPASLPLTQEVRIDAWVLAFTFGVALLTGLLFGLVPAFGASRLDVNAALKEGGRSMAGGTVRQRVRSLLVVSELALALMLLVGAGLLIKGFWRLRSVAPGFETEGLLTMRVELPEARYKEIPTQTQFRRELLERLNAQPGVEAAMVSELPLSGDFLTHNFVIEGRPAVATGEEPELQVRSVGGDYFRTMRIPLRQGRDLTTQDREGAPGVGLVNESFVRQYFNGANPVGARIRWARQQPVQWLTIVGVVADVKQFGLDQPEEPAFYYSYMQSEQPWKRWMYLVVRGPAEPAALAQQVKAQVWALDRQLPVTKVKPMTEVLATSIAAWRFNMTLMGVFAGAALLLAAVGIYGVVSFAVTQRTHEIGVRVALGAQGRDVLRLVMSQGLKLTLVGVGLGLFGAFAATRLMTSLLYGVGATDPATFVFIAALLALVALLACLLPARRATKVDPMVALRYE
ncbi:MAG TPA: ABC transporter permease [Pyrinomonadaceae bacterium]|jgi:putative ABC transport system permease protein